MPPHMVSQTLAFFSFVLILVLIHIPKFDCANVDSRYANCSHTFECLGHLNLTYPFWGSNRPNYCGHPAFELKNCTDDDPLISIESVDYRVLEVNQNQNTLVVARDDYWENLCPKEFHNTTLDSSIFSFSSDSQNLTLYYECSPPSVPLASVPSLFICDGWFNYFFVNIASGVSPPTCHEMIVLRISNSVVEKITNNTSPVPALKSGFGLSWKLNVSTYCDECTATGGYCGSDQNTGQFTCYCIDGPQSTKCSNSNSGSGSSSGIPSKRNLLIGLPVIILGSIIISSVIIYYYKRKRNKADMLDVKKLITNFGSFVPKRYNYFNVKKITNSFAERIGEGGFGTVYKGKLSNGHLVAVKMLNDSKHNGEDFINEVASIGRCSHVNIVTLLGFCHERSKRALIYEYMPNGSLDKFIFGDQGRMNTNRSLPWVTLYEITIGIARGLEYLHRGCNIGILHFDIKPQNILLDENFCPKISDFGLAKLWMRQESIMSMIGTRGTVGYIAPEVFSRNFGAISHKSDVYSYGMLVFEIIGGRKNVDARVSHTSQIYYPHWIYDDIESDKDLRIEGITSGEDKEIVKKMILMSFWCIQTRPSNRPSMSKVVEMLEGSSELLQIPPKPYFYSPERSTLQSTPLAIEEVS